MLLTCRTTSAYRKAARVAFAATAISALLIFVGCQKPPVPNDAQDACPLDSTTFSGWFQSGTPSVNGVVNPADSRNAPVPDCGFYQWSEQMFMWLTSPAPSTYGGGSHIFDSQAFFDVSPPDASGNRTLLAHTPGFIHAFPLRVAKLGPHRLPIVIDRAGQMLEVRPPNPNLKPLVRDPSGKTVEIAHARIERGRTILLDQEGKVIGAQHLAAPVEMADRKTTSPMIVQKFVIDRLPIFIDSALAVIDVEQGQAGDDSVLQAQTTANGSLVYYATMVNDVYAYYLTGAKKGLLTTVTPNQFPTTQTDLDQVVAFAVANGRPNPPFPDPNALAVEVKSSWVLASSLPNLSSYITMTATIPTYDQSNPNLWTQNGQQTVQLALVGMHVVGSTGGHPEMVWATFEHTNNTPLASFSYTANDGTTHNVNQDLSGNWVFAASNFSDTPNQPHMFFNGPPANTIQSEAGFTISPSDTLRVEPFGVDGNNLFENTEVISIDNHVLTLMPNGDVRGNYIMTGATWTPFGSNPGFGNNGVGTNKLANATMETYAQGSNCFSCHQNFSNPPPANVTNQVSHVFWQGPDKNGNPTGGLQPLF